MGEPLGQRRRKGLDADQLVASGEIGGRLGVRRVQTVHWWRKSDATFPTPVAILGADSGRRTYIWHRPETKAWARSRVLM